MKYKITVKAQTFDVEIGSVTGNTAQVSVDQIPYAVTFEALPGDGDARAHVQPAAPVDAAVLPIPAIPAAQPGAGTVAAPIPGVIIDIKVKIGDTVHAGQVVATMEAMKMENNLTTPVAGTVREIKVAKGAEVATGDVVMVIG